MLGLHIAVSRGAKIKLALSVIFVMLMGLFVYLNWEYWSGRQVDRHITAWVETRRTRIDPARPPSKDNPYDPSKTATVTVFANHDGRLEITERTVGGSLRTSLQFLPDPGRTQFDLWHDELATIDVIKDPVRRGLAYCGLSLTTTNQRNTRLVVAADLNDDQRAQERSARKNLSNALTLTDDGAATGAFEVRLYQQVLKALAAYRAREGDPTRDMTKAALASTVMELGIKYVRDVDKAKVAAINKYTDLVVDMLDAEQRQRVAAAAAQMFAARPKMTPRASAG